MRPFTTKQVISLFLVLALPFQVAAITAGPCLAAAKSKKASKPGSKTPIDTVGKQATRPLDLEGVKSNLEGRLSAMWRPMSAGKGMLLCELHFILHNTGSVTNTQVWRSSGQPNFDTLAKSVLDQGSPFGPFEGIEQVACIAQFRAEGKGCDVFVRFPDYAGADSHIDREILAKRTQQMNVIKLMQDRIVQAQKVLGSDSPKLWESINFLANTYKDIKEWDSAEAAYKWAISISKKANPPNFTNMAQSLSDLGDMYFWKGDLAGAEDCFKRVLNMPSLKPCPGLLSAVQHYAKMCFKNDREKDADLLYKRLEDIQAGKPLAPLPAKMIIDPSQPPDATAKDSTTSDTKGGDKPATSGDKPTTSGDKSTTSGDKPATSGDKPATSSDKPADTTASPKETKTDGKAGDSATTGASNKGNAASKADNPNKDIDSSKASDAVKAADPSKTTTPGNADPVSK